MSKQRVDFLTSLKIFFLFLNTSKILIPELKIIFSLNLWGWFYNDFMNLKSVPTSSPHFFFFFAFSVGIVKVYINPHGISHVHLDCIITHASNRML